MSKFIIFSSTAFKEEAKKELLGLFKDILFKELFEGKFIAIFKEPRDNVLKKVKEKDPIFIHNIMPIDLEIKINSNFDYIANQIIAKNLLNKDTSFAIECVGYNSKVKTRDFEVQVGSRIESKGFIVDRKNFNQLLAVVIVDDKAYIGSINSKLILFKYLDLAKKFSKENNRLNRAQYKIIEAIERFNIVLNGKNKFALDLGASPGGWTKVLASIGYKVIAIDKAELDKTLVKNQNIIHIKQRITNSNINGIKKEIKDIIKDKKIDIITNDINTSPNESVNLMNFFLEFLDKKGKVIMTLKATKKNVFNLLNETKKKLEKNYKIKKIKHLELNRRELTIYMIKK